MRKSQVVTLISWTGAIPDEVRGNEILSSDIYSFLRFYNYRMCNCKWTQLRYKSPLFRYPGAAIHPNITIMPIRAVIFDLLTALLDSWSLWDEAANNNPEQGYKWRRRYLELTFGCGAYQPYEELVRTAAKDVGLPETTPTHLIDNWDRLQPWPEVKQTLEKLKGKGYALGVVSNCSIELGRRALQRCETAESSMFNAFVTAEEVGFYKPHPDTYQAILSALGVKPDEAIFVAGSSGDVVGAAAVGMQVVWHNRKRLPALPGSAPLVEARSLDGALQGLL